jgi:hypothetical protein
MMLSGLGTDMTPAGALLALAWGAFACAGWLGKKVFDRRQSRDVRRDQLREPACQKIMDAFRIIREFTSACGGGGAGGCR